MAEGIDALIDLLEAERRSVLAGQFDQLGRVMQRKERLLDQLAQARPSAGDVTRLRHLAAANALLLQAALSGFRSGRARLRSGRATPTTMTYAGNGKAMALPPAQNSAGWRA